MDGIINRILKIVKQYQLSILLFGFELDPDNGQPWMAPWEEGLLIID